MLRDPRRRGRVRGAARPAAPPAGPSRRPARPLRPAAAGAHPEPRPTSRTRGAARREEALRRAAKLYEAEKYWDAIQLLEPVPSRHALRSCKTRAAAVLLARCNLKNPKWAQTRGGDADRRRRARTRRPSTRGRCSAQVYADKGLAEPRAVACTARSLELRPDHEEAAQLPRGTAAPEPPRGAASHRRACCASSSASPEPEARGSARKPVRWRHAPHRCRSCRARALARRRAPTSCVLLNGDRVTGEDRGPRHAPLPRCRRRTGCC